ncbi:MAG: hypothetical protein GY751_02450 [Bacteroidetes bacterium]|nr:hypothetical protein [Bacteroidota bacterium]
MAKYTGKIYTNTFNILPNRLPYFESRMARVKKAADSKIPKIPFDYEIKPGISVPLGKHLIPAAQANRLADARIDSNGNWVRDVLPVEITHGELASEDFERIGFIQFKDLTHLGGGKGFFPYVVDEGIVTQAEHDQRVIDIMPQLESLASNFNDKTDLNCHHCQPADKGDKRPRDIVQIVKATKDLKKTGGIQSNTFVMNIKKGDILQIGSGCFERYTGINVGGLAAFYELDRAVPAYGASGSPQGMTGFGYKTMGVWDYAERMVRYYNQREKEWLAMQGKSLWEVESPDQIYSKGTLAPLIDRRKNYTGGCFIEGAGNRLLQGRMFNMEIDANKPARWYLQPWTGTGSVEQMKEDWEAGLNDARIYIEVPEVNEMTGEEVIDPATGDVKMKDIAIPNPEYLDKMVHVRKRKGNYLGKGWRTAVVPVFPPATDSKYVQRTLNRMMDWITTLKAGGKYGDLQLRIKGTINLQYVGDKTKNDMNELWRMFMYADFERRKKADKKQQTKQFQKIGSDALSATYPDSKWYSFDKDDENYLVDYLGTIYGGSVSRYSSYYSNRGELAKAFSYKFQTVFLTPTEWAEFPVWRDAKKKKEAKDRAEREATNKYANEVNRIRREKFNQWPRPIMRKIHYDAPVDEFLAFMGWDSLNDPARFNHATSLFQISGDEVKVALLNEDEWDKVLTKFRPQVIGQSTPTLPTITQPVAPTPTPTPTITPTATPASMRQRITHAEAKGKSNAAIQTSTYQGNVGGLVPLVEGWVTWMSNPNGFPMYAAGVPYHQRPKGRSIQIIDPQGNCWVVFHPLSASFPRIGNYYNLFDVEVVQHNEYKKTGIKQTIITDPTGKENTDFVDATSP